MPDRVCPKCKTSLRPYDYFFCSFCGLKLPQELINDDVPVRRHLLNTSAHTKSTLSDHISLIWNIKTYYIVFLVMFIGLVFYGINQTKILEFARYEFLKNPPKINLPKSISSPSYDVVSPIASNAGDFKASAFTSIIPSSAEIYVEGWDTNLVSQYLVPQQNLALLFKRSDLLLDQGFSVFYYNNSWTFIFKPKDLDIVTELLEEFSDDFWKFKVINGLLVFSSSKEVFAQMEAALLGIEPSLEINPEFAAINNELSHNGKFKLIRLSSSSNDIIKNSLGGLDQESIAQINEVLKSEFKGIVIK